MTGATISGRMKNITVENTSLNALHEQGTERIENGNGRFWRSSNKKRTGLSGAI